MDLDFHFSTCSVLACCCLWLSNTVTLNDCFPACYPFPNRVCEMCSAKNRRQVPPTATFSCSTSNWVLPSNIKPHSSSPKAFTLFFFGKMTNGLCESKGRDTSGLGMSKQFEISWVNPWLPVVGIWVSSEEHEWGGVSWDCTKQKTSLSKLWFLSRDSHEAKGRQFSLLLLFFFSCCSHYKSTSKGSPPLTICCIVS